MPSRYEALGKECNARFYTSVRLMSSKGQCIGALCAHPILLQVSEAILTVAAAMTAECMAVRNTAAACAQVCDGHPAQGGRPFGGARARAAGHCEGLHVLHVPLLQPCNSASLYELSEQLVNAVMASSLVGSFLHVHAERLVKKDSSGPALTRGLIWRAGAHHGKEAGGEL